MITNWCPIGMLGSFLVSVALLMLCGDRKWQVVLLALVFALALALSVDVLQSIAEIVSQPFFWGATLS